MGCRWSVEGCMECRWGAGGVQRLQDRCKGCRQMGCRGCRQRAGGAGAAGAVQAGQPAPGRAITLPQLNPQRPLGNDQRSLSIYSHLPAGPGGTRGRGPGARRSAPTALLLSPRPPLPPPRSHHRPRSHLRSAAPPLGSARSRVPGPAPPGTARHGPARLGSARSGCAGRAVPQGTAEPSPEPGRHGPPAAGTGRRRGGGARPRLPLPGPARPRPSAARPEPTGMGDTRYRGRRRRSIPMPTPFHPLSPAPTGCSLGFSRDCTGPKGIKGIVRLGGSRGRGFLERQQAMAPTRAPSRALAVLSGSAGKVTSTHHPSAWGLRDNIVTAPHSSAPLHIPVGEGDLRSLFPMGTGAAGEAGHPQPYCNTPSAGHALGTVPEGFWGWGPPPSVLHLGRGGGNSSRPGGDTEPPSLEQEAAG